MLLHFTIVFVVFDCLLLAVRLSRDQREREREIVPSIFRPNIRMPLRSTNNNRSQQNVHQGTITTTTHNTFRDDDHEARPDEIMTIRMKYPPSPDKLTKSSSSLVRTTPYSSCHYLGDYLGLLFF